MKATLKDIAARVGVTSQLVSFYLNHPETTRVARETREKIDAAVKELNYRPNSVARPPLHREDRNHRPHHGRT